MVCGHAGRANQQAEKVIPSPAKFVPASEVDWEHVKRDMAEAREGIAPDATNPQQLDPISSGQDCPPSRMEFQALIARVLTLENVILRLQNGSPFATLREAIQPNGVNQP